MHRYFFFFLCLINFSLANTQQVVFVFAENFSSTKAKLIRYEKISGKFKQISTLITVNLGKKGLAWGKSQYKFKIKKNEPIKKEGDKKAVIGVFDLKKIYTYHKRLKTKMPYETVSKNHICIDDSNNKFYNKIIKTKNKHKYKSYENMLLKNETYEYVIQIEHNQKAIKKAGSCIFLHVQNPNKRQTSGCTSLQKNEIKKLIFWLDKQKNPILIQTTKKSCKRIKEKYKFINCKL